MGYESLLHEYFTTSIFKSEQNNDKMGLEGVTFSWLTRVALRVIFKVLENLQI